MDDAKRVGMCQGRAVLVYTLQLMEAWPGAVLYSTTQTDPQSLA